MMNALPPLASISLLAIELFAGTTLIAIHTLMIGLVARRARPAITVAAYLAAWFAVAVTFAVLAPVLPLSPDGRQLVAAIIAFPPFLIALGLVFTSKTLGALNAATPPAWPIRIQAYRMLGFLFLFPLLFYGAIPAAFALPAAIGDILTGAFALVVSRRQRGAVLWNLFGILDLIVAPTAAMLSHTDVLRMPPIAIIALFMGPPLGILTHVWSLRNLAAQRALTIDSERRSLSGRRLSPHPEGSALS